MREDIKMKKYKVLYKQVNDMYCKEFLNITQCCKKLKTSPSTYYKACKALGKESVNTPIQKGGNYDEQEVHNQKKVNKNDTSKKRKITTKKKKNTDHEEERTSSNINKRQKPKPGQMY